MQGNVYWRLSCTLACLSTCTQGVLCVTCRPHLYGVHGWLDKSRMHAGPPWNDSTALQAARRAEGCLVQFVALSVVVLALAPCLRAANMGWSMLVPELGCVGAWLELVACWLHSRHMQSMMWQIGCREAIGRCQLVHSTSNCSQKM